MKVFGKYVSNIGILLFLTVLPLYIENAYFNVVAAKSRAFFAVFAIMLVPMLIVVLYKSFKGREESGISVDIIDMSALCFCFAVLLSCALSSNIKGSFLGDDGWRIGGLAVLALVFLYFFFSRNHVYRQNLWLWVYGVNIFIFVIALFQFAGVDILGNSQRLVPKQLFQYISTYGNTNWYAGYLCLLLPMALVFFLSAKSRLSYWVNLIFISLALSNLLIAISDGAYIGLGFCAFFALFFVFKSVQRIKRALIVCMIFAFEAVIIRILPCYDAMLVKTTGISGAVFDLRISLPLLLISGLLLVLLCLKEKSVKNEAKLCKKLLILVYAALCVGVLMLVVHTVITFNDRWGSSRGLIWRVSFENFFNYDVKNKLFGIGPELLRNQYLEVQRIFENLPVLSSHSEPIQILVTTGIVGFTSYLFALFGVALSFKRYVRKNNGENILVYAFFLPMTAYFGQSLVNSATMVNLCLLCIMLAFYRIALCKNEKMI